MSPMRFFTARGETLELNDRTRGTLRGSFARLPGGVTHYELSGPMGGELVLMTPGLTIPLFYWDEFAAELHRAGFRTLTYSAYGRGYSDRAPGTYDQAFFVRQAAQLLEQLGLAGSVNHLIGTSMGALVAMALLQEKGFNARTLTLVGPAGLESKLPLGARLAKLPVLGALVGRVFGRGSVTKHLHRNVRDEAHLARLTTMISEAYQYKGSIYALFSTLRNFGLVNRAGLYEATGALGIPTLLAWGQEDQVTLVSRMKHVEHMLRPVTSHVVVECGHMVPFERPAQVAALFAAFVGDRRGV
jgi:pimeloyl-ACP methyl ester carboxylesterase